MRIDYSKLTDNRIYRWITKALELLFLALTGAYLFYQTARSTTFSMTWPSGLNRNLLVAMAVVAALRLPTVKWTRRKAAAALGLAAVYYMVYRSDRYQFLLYLAVLTVGLIDIDYRRILKVYLVSTGAVYCTAVLAGMSGAITNYVYVSSGRGLRSAWGICYPTDFASKGLFLLVMLWVVWKKLPDWAMLIPCAAFIWMARVIAFSWNSTICGAVFLCAILYCAFEHRVVDRHRGLGWMKRGTELFETVAFPLCALVMFGLMLIYARGMNAGYRLDNLLSSRLSLGVEAWQKHGLSLFGTPFSQVGNGFSTMPRANYNFVDSSYPLILIRYGAVMFLAICAIWGNMARQAIRCKDRRLLLALGIIAIHSFAEHHFIEVRYNILLAMPLASFAAAEVEERVAAVDRKTILAHVVTAMVCCVILWLVAPIAVSGLRTVLEYKGLCMAKKTGWTLMGIYLGIIAFVAAVIWAVDRLIRSLLTRRAVAVPAIALAVCACVGVGGWVYTNNTVSAAAEANADLIESDRKALEIATKSATGKVYSGILPAAYGRRIDGISYSAFTEDDLARLRGSTALIETDNEHILFFDSSCLYTQISEKHALYTSDMAVIEALTEAGYHLTGYYNNIQTVSLSRAAKFSGLSYSKKNGLVLSKKAKTLKKGPYFNLYAGKYTVTYELSLPKSAKRDSKTVCKLGVITDKGKNKLLSKAITADQFDENGILTVLIPFSIPDSKNVAFTATIKNNRKVYIRSIRFTRTPDYDMHGLYDTQLRKVRDEYYTLEGTPTMGPSGYFAAEYGYDGRKNNNLIRYFNQKNELTLHTSGYAELRRGFNAKGQIVREEYYGTDGEPIALTNRAAVVEWEYDADGNITVIRYYGIDGKPVITTSGYAELHRSFDKDGRVINEEYLGIDGEPIPLTSGQYNITQEFDKAGNVTVRRFHGDDGKLKLRSEGYAEVQWKYNGMHQIIREAFFDDEGQPVMINVGYAVDEREYDDAGNVKVYRYYDTEGNPCKITSGYAELHRKFNEQRRVVREEYYGVDGLPINLYYGYCAIENEYDEVGNVSVWRFYGTEGQPVMRTDGYAEVHWQYNAMRQIVREEFYDTDGLPVMINNGSAGNEREYDGAGNATVYRYFDTNGRPVVIVPGYAEVHRTFDEMRQIVREEYYGTDGMPLIQPEGHCMLEQEFDDMGNVAVKRYFDDKNQPIAICEGYAEIRRTYNNKKQVIHEAYFDTEGQPYVRAAGHVAIEQEYDESGKLAVRRYLDAQGKAVQRTDGYSEARWIYDAEAGVRNVTFYDLNGNEITIDGINLMMDCPSGWSEWYTPYRNTINNIFNISSINLGNMVAGDTYTCQIEIEFKGVKVTENQEFRFWTQGAIDGKWVEGNIWNTSLVYLESVPEDGIYHYATTQEIVEDRVCSDLFNIGFRCDYWADGSFRVKYVKVEKGTDATEWTPSI